MSQPFFDKPRLLCKDWLEVDPEAKGIPLFANPTVRQPGYKPIPTHEAGLVQKKWIQKNTRANMHQIYRTLKQLTH